jgi:hypothetical protein
MSANGPQEFMEPGSGAIPYSVGEDDSALTGRRIPTPPVGFDGSVVNTAITVTGSPDPLPEQLIPPYMFQGLSPYIT